MAKPTEFTIDGKTSYTFWNSPSAKSPTKIIEPQDTQAVAVMWDSEALKFIPIYFTDIQVKGETLPDDVKANGTIAETQNGADVFIISLPGKQVRENLDAKLRDWVKEIERIAEAKKLLDLTNPPIKMSADKRAKRRRAISIAIGEFIITEVQRHIGKSKITAPETPAVVTPVAVVEPEPVVEPPKVVAQPPAAAPIAPPVEPPITIAPASREVAARIPPATEQPDADPTLDDLRPAAALPQGDPGQVVYTGTVASNSGQRGFAHVTPDRGQVIPGQDRQDLLMHINTVPLHLRDGTVRGGTKLRPGDRIAFHAGLDRGRVQVTRVIGREGEAVPAATVQQSAREPEQRRASEIGAPTTIDTVTHDAIMQAVKDGKVFRGKLRFSSWNKIRTLAIFVQDRLPSDVQPSEDDSIIAHADHLKTYPGVNIKQLVFGSVIKVGLWENPLTGRTEVLPSEYDSNTPPARPQKADGSPIVYARPPRDRGNDKS